MKIKLNKKGMSLPAMLAIITFLIGSLLTIITTTVNRAELIEKSIDSSEEYVNYVNNIKAVQSIIVRDEITDQGEVAILASYFNVQFDQPNPAIYRFYKELETVSHTVSGYLAKNTVGIQTYQELFKFTGLEDDFELSPLINATTMLKEYTIEYVSQHFPGESLDADLSSFKDIVKYFEKLSGYTEEKPKFIENQRNPVINDYIFIDGDVELKDKNLTIEPGYLLIIDGDLEVEGDVTITGNILINGDFEIDGKNKDDRNIIGTFYVEGDVKVAQSTNIGSEARPSFFMVKGDVELENKVTVYGYFLADDFEGKEGDIFITGGVYALDDLDVKDKNIEANTSLTEADLQDYGVSTTILVESTSGSLTFTYTEPKFE